MKWTTSVEFRHPDTGQLDRHDCPVLKSRKGLLLIRRIDGRLSVTHAATGLMVHRFAYFEPHEKEAAIAAFEAVFPLADWRQSPKQIAAAKLKAQLDALFYPGVE